MSDEAPERFTLAQVRSNSGHGTFDVVVSRSSIGWLVDLLAEAYIYRMQSIVDAQIAAALKTARAKAPEVQKLVDDAYCTACAQKVCAIPDHAGYAR